jgi:murein endopeptidase
VEDLQRENDLPSTVVVVGQRLRVPTREPKIRLAPGQSVGRPNRGELRASDRLPAGRSWHLRRPERSYGAHHVVDHTRAALEALGSDGVCRHAVAVGDLSAPQGGFIPGHRSHQSGRDVDLGLCFRRKPEAYPAEFVVAERDTLDLRATWELVLQFARTQRRAGGAERMFLDYEVQGWLYDDARRRGVAPEVLADVLQYPRGRWAREGFVRHLGNHEDHLHVRFRCVDGDESCR